MKIKCDILCFSDPVNFFDDQLWFHHALTYNNFEPTSVVFTQDALTQDDIQGKDLIFLDFGGLCKDENYFILMTKLENLIKDNEDKLFVMALTMPEWFYQSEGILKCSNVISFNRNDIENYIEAFKFFMDNK